MKRVSRFIPTPRDFLEGETLFQLTTSELGPTALALMLLLNCTAQSTDPPGALLAGPLSVDQLVEGDFVMVSDPVTRSLPERAPVAFLRDGSLTAEKTGLADSWWLEGTQVLWIGQRRFSWDPERKCLFSPHAPGYLLGWCLESRREDDTRQSQ